MRVLRISIVAALVALCAGAVAMAQSNANPFQPLAGAKWGAAPPMLPAGAQIAVLYGDPTKPAPYAVRLKFPPNYDIAAHSHPTDENVVVTSGQVFFGMGDKLDRAAGKPLGPNGFISAPANMNHYAYTKSESTIVLFGMGPVEFKYVNPKDDPRNKK